MTRRRTVGQLLRETREGFGSDLHRVASALRIRAAYLEAIEDGRYDRLPGPVYALGFVRAYATHLGLDGEEAVRRFKLEAEGLEGQRDLSFPVPLSERSIPGGAMLLAALLLAVCGYGLWYYLSSTARPHPERVSPVPAELAKDLPPPASPAAPEMAAPPATGDAVQSASPTAASAPAATPGAAAPALPPPPAPAATPAAPAAAVTPPAPVAAAPSSATPPLAVASPSAPATPAEMPAASPAPAAPTSAPAAPPASPPALPPQTAAAPAVPPTGGATPVPDQPHVYGLANGETRVVIHATSDSWVQVRDADHVPIFTRQLHAGDSYHVPDRPGLTMRTGRGVALEITVDGKTAPAIGGAVRPNVSLDPARLLAGTALGASEEHP